MGRDVHEVEKMADMLIRILAEGHEVSLAKWIQSQIKEAIVAEREACAEMVHQLWLDLKADNDTVEDATIRNVTNCTLNLLNGLAAAIRAREEADDEA